MNPRILKLRIEEESSYYRVTWTGKVNVFDKIKQYKLK